MVEFTNLRTDKNWIYGDAYQEHYNARAKIKLSKHQDKLDIIFSSGDDNSCDIRKACWNLQDIYERNNNSFPDTKVIVMWG